MEKTTMCRMVAAKLDPVEEFRLALRKAAHEYHCAQADPRRDLVAERLYRAARALVAAELIHEIKG